MGTAISDLVGVSAADLVAASAASLFRCFMSFACSSDPEASVLHQNEVN